MKKGWLVLYIVIFLCVLFTSVWYFWLHSEKCTDIICFQKNFLECSRATYTSRGEWAYDYKILGAKDGECLIDVKLIFAGLEPKFSSIVGKSMKCSVPLRKIDMPETDLDYCSGPLKEEMQYLIIKDLFQYTSENLGKENV